TPYGRCWARPTPCSAPDPPCWNATSTFPRSTSSSVSSAASAATSPRHRAAVVQPERLDDALAGCQDAFAAHIRHPEGHPPPAGIDPDRMRVYRELFFNNVARLLAGNFPVIRRIHGERWQALVRDFYRGHGCRTPLFPEIPREFLRWLAAGQGRQPWLAELAHYEWVELALQVSEARLDDVPHDDLRAPGTDVAAALLDGRPLL